MARASCRKWPLEEEPGEDERHFSGWGRSIQLRRGTEVGKQLAAPVLEGAWQENTAEIARGSWHRCLCRRNGI